MKPRMVPSSETITATGIGFSLLNVYLLSIVNEFADYLRILNLPPNSEHDTACVYLVVCLPDFF